MWDIRQHLQADLKNGAEFSALGLGVHAGEKPQTSPIPCVVWRCVRLIRGEDIRADDGTREAKFELVIWAADLERCLVISAALAERYHGTEGYDFGGRGTVGDGNYVAPLDMGSSRVVNEYDGDRVSDTFSEAGAVALTLEIEFMWVEPA